MERDFRVDPRVGDIIRKKRRGKTHSFAMRRVEKIGTMETCVQYSTVSTAGRISRHSIWLSTWQQWGKAAEVFNAVAE